MLSPRTTTRGRVAVGAAGAGAASGAAAGPGAAAPTPSGGAPHAPASSATAATNTAPSRRAGDFPTPGTHFRMAYRTLPLVPEFPTFGRRLSSANAAHLPQPQPDLDPAPRHV